MRTSKNLLTALAVILLIAIPSKPSFAHTDVVSTTPSAGEAVAGGEQLISVTFNENILNLANSTEIVVVDPTGNPVKADCSGVEDKTIYTNAFLPTQGDYEVTWRTVAEDGHPISGKFTFSVSGDAQTEYTVPACASDTPTVEPTPKVIATPLAAAEENHENHNSGLNPFVGSGLAVIAVAVIAWLLFRRKSASKE